LALIKAKLNRLGVILGLLFLSFWINVAGMVTNPVGSFFLPQARFWELLSGGVVACLLRGHDYRVSVSSISVINKSMDQTIADAVISKLLAGGYYAGLMVIITSLFYVNDQMKFPGWVAVLPVIGASIVVYAGGLRSSYKKILENKVFVFIGLISYPLYLWHWPLLVFLRLIENRPLNPHETGYCILASFILSALTYLLLEKPIRKCEKSPALIIFLVSCAVSVLAIGYATKKSRGFPSRFPALISQLTDYSFGYSEMYRSGYCLLGKDQTYKDYDSICFGRGVVVSNAYCFWGTLMPHICTQDLKPFSEMTRI
jgi:peptidoglycan/LPS O-acetylase OafA/YrhL